MQNPIIRRVNRSISTRTQYVLRTAVFLPIGQFAMDRPFKAPLELGGSKHEKPRVLRNG